MSEPIVLRGGTVLTMDDAHTVLADARRPGRRRPDRGGRPGPRGARGHHEIDASGGIVMPGMIDTHRHMWQTAMRGYGADWTLTQYFVWYYLEHGKIFRPRGHPRRQPAVGDRGARRGRHHHRRLVARPADRRARRRGGRRAAGGPRPLRARLRQHPGRARGSGRRRPGVPRLRRAARSGARRHARLPDRLRRHRRPGVPRAGRLRGGARPRRRRSPRTPACGARPTTTASGSCTSTAS